MGENVRDEAGRETRARVVGAARACETRGEDASPRSLDRDVDPRRPYPRSARRRARRLRSRIGRWRDATTRSGDGVTEPSMRDRLGQGPRKHVPSTPAACKSRVASSEDAILLFARVCDGQVRQSLAGRAARAAVASRVGEVRLFSLVKNGCFTSIGRFEPEVLGSRETSSPSLRFYAFSFEGQSDESVNS